MTVGTLFLYLCSVKVMAAQGMKMIRIMEQEWEKAMWAQICAHILQLLHVVEPFVVAAAGDEFVVLAVLHDLALVEDVDFVGMLDGRQAVCNGYGGARLHEVLQCLLDQSLGLGVEGRGGLVEDEDGRIFQDGACYGEALALSAAEPSAAVAYHGVVAVLGLHDEVVGVGNLGSFDDLLHGGVFDTEGDVVVEGVVEEDGLLVDVADELAQLGYAHGLDVAAVDEHLSLVDVVVAWNEVNQRGLSGAGLSDDGYGLALGDDEVDVAQHPLFAVAEGDVAEGYLVAEGVDGMGAEGVLDGVLGQQYLVDALHGGQSLGNVVARLGEVFQGVDDGVEHDHVVDEDGAGECVVVEHEDAAKPEYDDNHDGAQEFGHGVGRGLSDVDAHDVVAVGGVDFVEAAVHLLLGTEGLDDAQSAQRLFYLAHGVAPK